jgi:hypothetical protein
MATEFGKDISCTTSLRTGRFSTGVRLVAEAAFRRLITPRGMLAGGEEEADYGLDLTELVGSAETDRDAAALPGRIESELKKDKRIESVTAEVTVSRNGPSTSLAVSIRGVTAEGPFTLQVAASDVTVELLGIETEAA